MPMSSWEVPDLFQLINKNNISSLMDFAQNPWVLSAMNFFEVQARIWDAWLALTIHGLDVAHQRISHGVGPGSFRA